MPKRCRAAAQEIKVSKPDAHGATVVKRVAAKGHEESHGGSWKVAFADFCLALLCLFLVLWLLASREKEVLEQVMRAADSSRIDEGAGLMAQSLGGPRGSLIDREPMPPREGMSAPGQDFARSETEADGKRAMRVRYESEADLASLARVMQKLSADAGLEGNLQAVVTPYGLRVMLHDTDEQGMFERGSWYASERFRTLLRSLGPLFARMENQMLIVGHTDSVKYANRGHAAFSNWTLSSNRALTARTQLLAGGMPTISVLQVVGMADRAPLNPQDLTAAMNRRIELLILTTRQAELVSAMYGLPTERLPFAEGAHAAMPDRATLEELRAELAGPGPGNTR
ncbi:MAG: OmpA family protein [Gammaproteobacteria bacterium]|jgi:chemotaxis protein MotB|nr:OmpA family protein [Gammaproteobacteria bacterium]MBU0773480.1 OmpA family protein [Gammaproteobacteria bacterium]MBU0856690.1 OmpA family protein [Gammaproteobacteria bacterium]MBU1846780.1 OmpA family protein [Gammaproteobacteria bacterium]